MPVEPLRVLMLDVPGMLQDILVAQLQQDPGIDLLVAQGTAGWLASIGRFQPEVVIAACSDARKAWAEGGLDVYLLRPDAGAITRIELRSVSEEMGNASLAELVASIKAGKER